MTVNQYYRDVLSFISFALIFSYHSSVRSSHESLIYPKSYFSFSPGLAQPTNALFESSLNISYKLKTAVCVKHLFVILALLFSKFL